MITQAATSYTTFTTLDSVHQSMLRFKSGRSEALRRFLVKKDMGRDGHCWSLTKFVLLFYKFNQTLPTSLTYSIEHAIHNRSNGDMRL